MEREPTRWLDYQQILDHPHGPTRAALARKAIAARNGAVSTDLLQEQFGIQTDDDAVALLETHLLYHEEGIALREGSQPADRTDGTADAVDLVGFARSSFESDVAAAKALKHEVRRLIAMREWHDAALLLVQGLYHLHGNRRRGVVKLFAKVAPHDPIARLYHGKALLRGEHCRRNLDRGLELLHESSFDEDPVQAGYAHLLMGEVLITVPGQGYRALRHFENAAYLGWEDASEPAGVICQIGGSGAPIDIPRAIRNFKYGMSKGQLSCCTKYVVMVLKGEAPYDPSWRELFAEALEQREMLAVRIQRELAEADAEASGDTDVLIEQCRLRLDFPEIRLVEPMSAGLVVAEA